MYLSPINYQQQSSRTNLAFGSELPRLFEQPAEKIVQNSKTIRNELLEKYAETMKMSVEDAIKELRTQKYDY